MRSARPVAVWLSLFIGLFGSRTGANAWWNDKWAFRKEITFDLTPAGADIPGAPADVPVLVRLSLAQLRLLRRHQARSAPTCASSRATTRRRSNPTSNATTRRRRSRSCGCACRGSPVARTPTRSSCTTATRKCRAPRRSAGTYDKNQSLVYHFGAPASSPQDSTAYKAEPTSFTAEVNAASLIGAGARSSPARTTSRSPRTAPLRLVPAQGMTISAWVRIDAAQQNAYIAALEDNGKSLVLGLDGTTIFARWSGTPAGPAVVAQSGVQMTTGEWHHLALRVGDGQMTLLVDGAEAGQAAVDAHRSRRHADHRQLRAERQRLHRRAGRARSLERRAQDRMDQGRRAQPGHGRAARRVRRRRAEGQRRRRVLLHHHPAQRDRRRLGDHRHPDRDVRRLGHGDGRQGAVPESRRARQLEVPRRVPSRCATTPPRSRSAKAARTTTKATRSRARAARRSSPR